VARPIRRRIAGTRLPGPKVEGWAAPNDDIPGNLPLGEKLETDSGYRPSGCIHGFPLFANDTTLCPICSYFGLQLRW